MVPELVAREDMNQFSYASRHGKPLLADYLDRELTDGARIVTENAGFAALVPYWATWPYETIIIPKRHLRSLADFTETDIAHLAAIMKDLGIRYDNLFKTDFPYSMGVHQAPTNGRENAHWQFHMHYYPPLLRSATVKKFMVGYEMMAMSQRDITAETSAETLRKQPTTHYREGAST